MTDPAPADDERTRTIRTLIELAAGHSPSDCWDDQRAMELLRSQSSPEEARRLGAADDVVRHIWPESKPEER